MTAGERRFAERLRELLEDDYLVWFDIGVGRRQRRYPDFIVLHPSRGLLFLEVKDWKLDTIRSINAKEVELLTPQGLVTKLNPLEQARLSVFPVINRLQKDPALLAADGRYAGRLLFPYGYGVVLTNITRRQFESMGDAFAREQMLPDHLVICKDEMLPSTDPEAFQSRLWDMFPYCFGGRLTKPQIDRIRWHLFPEIRVGEPTTGDMFAGEEVIPQIVRVMDTQQEALARSLGGGHRVIHGVAGSGKTLILGFRCLHLAGLSTKPILVLCFNVVLAAKLRAFVEAHGIEGKVEVAHFHRWCKSQLKLYGVSWQNYEGPPYEAQVRAVIDGVEKGWIPRAQYDAVMIDEGQDFEADWLKLITQMVDPKTNSLLLLYDDAQSIYQNRKGLGFSLKSVGIQAQGRTTVLKINYRNTQEILAFSHDFLAHFLGGSEESSAALSMQPQSAGWQGEPPVFRCFDSLEREVRFAVACIGKWQRDGRSPSDMAVLCENQGLIGRVAGALRAAGIAALGAANSEFKQKYDPKAEQVLVTTIHSGKGLEFSRVVVIGVGELEDTEERREENAKLLYVGMTRAMKGLVVTASKENAFTVHLQKLCPPATAAANGRCLASEGSAATI